MTEEKKPTEPEADKESIAQPVETRPYLEGYETRKDVIVTEDDGEY